MIRATAKQAAPNDVEIACCWSSGCFWVKLLSPAAEEWIAAHTPLEPEWIRPAVLLEADDWRGRAFFVANIIAAETIREQMNTAGLSVALLRLPPEKAVWRKEAEKIAEEVRAGTRGWCLPEPDQNDRRPRNAFGYLVGFGEAVRRHYEELS